MQRESFFQKIKIHVISTDEFQCARVSCAVGVVIALRVHFTPAGQRGSNSERTMHSVDAMIIPPNAWPNSTPRFAAEMYWLVAKRKLAARHSHPTALSGEVAACAGVDDGDRCA